MKKKFPLVVLKAIEPLYARIEQESLKLDKTAQTLLVVKDADKDSDFFFEIIAHLPTNHGLGFKYRYKPQSINEVAETSGLTPLNNIINLFDNWIKLVNEYSSVKTHYDDPVLKKYADSFYTEFESADEDATTVSFTVKQQLLLSSALDQVIQILETKRTDHNEEAVNELVKQAEEIQDTLTEDTKQETLTKLSKLFAKVQKLGIKFIKDVYPIVQKEIIGAAIKSGIQHLGDVIHQLNP